MSQFHPEHLIHDVYWVDFLLKHSLHGAEAAPYNNLTICLHFDKNKIKWRYFSKKSRDKMIYNQTRSIFVLWDLYVHKCLLVLPNTIRSYFWMWLGEMIKMLSFTSGLEPILSTLSYHDIGALRDDVSSEAILISATNRGCYEDNLISLTACYAKSLFCFFVLAHLWHNHTSGISPHTASTSVWETLPLNSCCLCFCVVVVARGMN